MSLPNRWSIKAKNEEERLSIGMYFNELFAMSHYTTQQNCYYHYSRFGNCCTSINLQMGYKQITFDQFKQYVLNQQINIEYEIY